jgi:hypothetical protein
MSCCSSKGIGTSHINWQRAQIAKNVQKEAKNVQNEAGKATYALTESPLGNVGNILELSSIETDRLLRMSLLITPINLSDISKTASKSYSTDQNRFS